jgi:hypothetical protein
MMNLLVGAGGYEYSGCCIADTRQALRQIHKRPGIFQDCAFPYTAPKITAGWLRQPKRAQLSIESREYG